MAKLTLLEGENVQKTAEVKLEKNSHVSIPVQAPHLWSAEDPFLYELKNRGQKGRRDKRVHQPESRVPAF